MEVSLQSFRRRFTYDQQKDLLGKGGFGDVYKGYDNEDQIFVALKIAHASSDNKHNLINEIRRFKKLNHPNIVKHIEAYEVNTGGTDIHGKPILNHVGILEYADKGTLADLLKNPKEYESFGNLRSVLEDLANDIIDGLAYLHSQNIIHRDLKPTNILLFSEGDKLRAKITDFGIAKQADATAASTQLVGTVEYMAPEYFTTGNITKASDLWSLGVMLLEALSGKHPFGKTTQGLSNQQIINNILSTDLANLTQTLTEPLKGTINRCLMREAYLRPQSAETLKELMLNNGDDFAEKTQIISTKKKVSETQKEKSKWRGLISALFDFDVRNGRWKKVLARELMVFLLLVIIAGFLFFITSSIDYLVKKSRNTEQREIYMKRVYGELKSFHNINLPDFSVFKKRYDSYEGHNLLIQKLSKRTDVNFWHLIKNGSELYNYELLYKNYKNFLDYKGSISASIVTFLLVIIFYPLRFFSVVIIWSFKTLRK